MNNLLNFAFVSVIRSFLLVGIALLASCGAPANDEPDDYQQIIDSDTLRVITMNTSTSYFIYRDQEMGYHYDIDRKSVV